MYPNNDDTLNAGTQNVAQPEENTNEVKNQQAGKKLNMKDAAAFVAGGVAGAGASVAANAFASMSDDPATAENAEELVAEESVEEAPAAASQSKPQPAPAPEPAKEEATETPRQPEQPSDPRVIPASHTTTTTEEPAFYRENEVKIESIETRQTDEGETYHTASGTVNGHAAQFIDDGHGNVVGYAVDENDNQQMDDNEIVRGGQNLTMGNLAEHMVEDEVTPEPVPTPTGGVQVIAVESDVEMGGHSVDMAVVAVGDTAGVLVDVTQNGEVDLMAVDANHDGNFGEDETQVVTDSHIPMPTADDVSPEMVSNDIADGGDLPDYSNDSDITVYDV